MEYINLNTNDPEEFVLAKAELNKVLLDNEIIDKKLSLDEFVKFLKIDSNILMTNDNKVIPFSIQKYDNYEKIFFVSDDINKEILDSNLSEIDFDLSKLTHLTRIDVYKDILIGKNFFIIDNEYYYNKKGA